MPLTKPTSSQLEAAGARWSARIGKAHRAECDTVRKLYASGTITERRGDELVGSVAAGRGLPSVVATLAALPPHRPGSGKAAMTRMLVAMKHPGLKG